VDLYLDEKLDKGRVQSARAESSTETAEPELERLRSRQSRIRELERDREDLLESYARIIPEQLDALLPEERHRIYKMPNLCVIGYQDGSIELTWTYEGFSRSW
jgi:predicted transcriptional regulator